jgi:hypothetical protein
MYSYLYIELFYNPLYTLQRNELLPFFIHRVFRFVICYDYNMIRHFEQRRFVGRTVLLVQLLILVYIGQYWGNFRRRAFNVHALFELICIEQGWGHKFGCNADVHARSTEEK